MKKKQIRKEQNRLKKERNQIYMDFNDKKDVMKIVWVTIGVILFILLVFVVINIANGTWNIFTKENDTVSEIDPTLVLCGTMFGKSEDEYLVLAYNFENKNQTIYPALRESYQYFANIYLLDLDSGFNKSCIGDKFNIVSDATKIKLAGPALLRIKGNKIVGSYTTKDSIKNYLTNLK